jgi:uncharacterized lipoprotein YmbA
MPSFHAFNQPRPRRAFALLAGVLTAGFLSGCTLLQPRADPTKFYVLTAPAAAVPLGPCQPAILTIALPSYLAPKLMAVRTDANEIHYAEFARWAEPLDEGIGRVLRVTLAATLQAGNAAGNAPAEGPAEDAVTIRVQACEGVLGSGGDGSMALALTWEIRRPGSPSIPVKIGGFTAPPVVWDGQDYGQLARQLSAGIAGAARGLAADLAPAAAGRGPNP